MSEQNPKSITWAFYEFLKEKTLGNDTSVSQKDVYEYLKSKCFKISWSEIQNQHNDHCRALKDLVDEINFNERFDKFVYQKDYQYRLASKEEAEQILSDYDKKARIAFSRYNTMLSKAKRDGIGKLVNNAGNEMKPGNEEFHESYNRPKPTEHKVYVTVDEEVQGGLSYSKILIMKFPLEIPESELEDRIKANLLSNQTLTHWRKC